MIPRMAGAETGTIPYIPMNPIGDFGVMSATCPGLSRPALPIDLGRSGSALSRHNLLTTRVRGSSRDGSHRPGRRGLNASYCRFWRMRDFLAVAESTEYTFPPLARLSAPQSECSLRHALLTPGRISAPCLTGYRACPKRAFAHSTAPLMARDMRSMVPRPKRYGSAFSAKVENFIRAYCGK